MRYVWRAVLFLMLLAGTVIIGATLWLFFETRRWKDVPAERWVCIDRYGYGPDVVYEPRHPGTHVIVEAEDQVNLFALSCVNKAGTNCFDNDGWGSATINVRGGSVPYAVAFDHKSSGIDDSYRHHVRLLNDFARDVIAAFRRGKNADITTYGHKDEVMKVTMINLEGFGLAMDQCVALWAKERQKRQTGRT